MNPLGGPLAQAGMDPGSYGIIFLTSETNPTLSLIIHTSSFHRGVILNHVRVLVVSKVILVV